MEKNVRMFFGNVVLEKKMEWRGSVKGLIPEITEFAKSHGAIVPEDGPVVEDDLESGLLQATWQSVYLDRGAVNEDRTITVLSQSDPKKEGPVSKKEDNSNKEKQEPQKKEPEVQIKIDEQPKKVENVPEKQDVIIEIKDPIEKKDPEPELGPSALQLMRQNIEHVVILMLENRGLDTVLGWLYEDEDPDKIVGASTDDRDYFDALGHLRAEEKGNFFDDLKPAVYRTGNPVELSEKNQKINKTFYVRKGAQFPHSPFIYPHEDHEHITLQVFGEAFANQQGSPTHDEVINAGKDPAPMNGFAKDYLSNVLSRHEPAKKSAQVQAKCIQDLFDVYTPDQLPVLNGLARHYAVSDEWFCSVPTQTNANRAFFHAGTSLGLSKNGYLMKLNTDLTRNLADDRFNCKTMWHVLSVDGAQKKTPKEGKPITWKHYHHVYHYPSRVNKGPYTWRLFPLVKKDGLSPDPHDDPKVNNNNTCFLNVNHFALDIKNDKLPTVSIIEPAWSYGYTTDHSQGHDPRGAQGNDYHAPGDTTRGEDLVKRVYRALCSNDKVWKKTLLVITFDENGGTYDHVPPPWGAAPPWGDAKNFDRSGQGRDKVLKKAREFNFNFDRFGVRVPTLLISPYIARGTVFRSKAYDYKNQTGTPFDHTSIMKTIFKWLDIDQGSDKAWGLGERVKAAPTFEDVFTATQRNDAEPFENEPSWFEDGRGEPLRYGRSFRLRNPGSNKYLGRAYPGVSEWYPTMLSPVDDCFLTLVKLEVKQDGSYDVDINAMANGAIVFNEDVVMICSREEKLGTKRYIGAYQSFTNCIYAENNVYQDPNIGWKIQIEGAVSQMEICYGDRVYFFNRGSGRSSNSVVGQETYHFHRLCETNGYTAASQRQWAPWVLEEPIRPNVQGSDVSGTTALTLWENDDLVLGQNGTGLKPADLENPPTPEKLYLTNAKGETINGTIENGTVVRIKREDGQFLGNWQTGCYFSAKSERENGQRWKVLIKGYPMDDTRIKDGERVYIISMSEKYMGYHLLNKSGKLNTSRDSFQNWVLKKFV